MLFRLGFVFDSVCALFAGLITNKLGRKKTTTIFELLAWPGSCFIYLFANNFWLFALGRIFNSAKMISTVSWNLMMVEDSDDIQRINAFNLITLIEIALGVITPLGGIVVAQTGVVIAEKIFLLFAVICMTTSMTLRNKFYTETQMGKQTKESFKSMGVKDTIKNVLHPDMVRIILKSPAIVLFISINILYNMYLNIGSNYSMYFALYLTEVLHLKQSVISVVGGVNAAVLFFICIFINPIVSRRIRGTRDMTVALISGFAFQLCYVILMLLIPKNSLFMACLSISSYAVGLAMVRTYISSLQASVTEGNEKYRAGIYSIINLLFSVGCILVGLVSGYLYTFNKYSLYIASIVILVCCIAITFRLERLQMKIENAHEG